MNARRVLTNPLAIIVPLVVVLLLGWSQYVKSGRALNLPTANLLSNGSFDSYNPDNTPQSWSLSSYGSLTHASTQSRGYVSGQQYNLTVRQYKSGSIELTSPKVTLKPATIYLYKGYYHSTLDFDLLIKYYYANGTEQLRYIRSYPGKDDPWSTASIAFRSNSNVKAVQIVYRGAGNGTLQLDSSYLEARTNGMYLAPEAADTNMLIPNANLRQSGGGKPLDWSTYRSGKNRASFAYVAKPHEQPYLSTKVDAYKSGEAKWQYAPQHVSAGQRFSFGITYRSTVPSNIVVEYLLHNGKRRFDTIATLTPAHEWTRYQTQFEAPSGSSTVFASVVLHANGQVNTRDYALRDITKSGERQFKRPLVSITFDDGWESISQNAIPYLNTYGYRGTFYLNPSTFGATDFLNKREVQTLAKAGNEITSHGMSHIDLTTVNAVELGSQLQSAAASLQSITGIDQRNFAPPYGKSDAEVQYYARNYYRSLRTTDNGLNTRQNFDPYNLKVLYIDSTTTPQEVKHALAEAKTYRGWLIFVYHRIQPKLSTPQGAGENTIVRPAEFARQLQLIHDSTITVTTVDAALQELRQQ